MEMYSCVWGCVGVVSVVYSASVSLTSSWQYHYMIIDNNSKGEKVHHLLLSFRRSCAIMNASPCAALSLPSWHSLDFELFSCTTTVFPCTTRILLHNCRIWTDIACRAWVVREEHVPCAGCFVRFPACSQDWQLCVVRASRRQAALVGRPVECRQDWPSRC